MTNSVFAVRNRHHKMLGGKKMSKYDALCLIKDFPGMGIDEISHKLNVSKSVMQKYLTHLRRSGKIKVVGVPGKSAGQLLYTYYVVKFL
jgi:predicted transcriptional regulator